MCPLLCGLGTEGPARSDDLYVLISILIPPPLAKVRATEPFITESRSNKTPNISFFCFSWLYAQTTGTGLPYALHSASTALACTGQSSPALSWIVKP